MAKVLLANAADIKAQDKVRAAAAASHVPRARLGAFYHVAASTLQCLTPLACLPVLQDGRTPLHKACERGCLAVGVMLLENQADVAALDMVRVRQKGVGSRHPA